MRVKKHSVLSRRERLELFLGSPLLLALLGIEIARIWRAIQGDPLLITGLTGFDVTVQWSASPYFFILGMAVHILIIMVIVGALHHQVRQGRRWRSANRH
jgi:hypothetical protein